MLAVYVRGCINLLIFDCFFTVHYLALLKDRFLKMMLMKSLNPSAFLYKSIGSDNSFTLIENNFRFLS